MAFQSVPSTAQVFVTFTLNGQVIGNTFYFRHSGGYTQSNLDELAADMDAWFSTEMLPFLVDDGQYEGVIVRGLENEIDYSAENNDNAGPGVLTSPPLPSQVAFCCKRLSGQTGRSARGRVYIGGLAYDSLYSNENEMTVSRIAEILAALLEIATYAVTHGWIEVIVSRWSQGMKRATAQTLDVVDWTFSDPVVDTQRRRLH